MKALIQRVTNAKVHINRKTKSSINKGLVIFIGFTDNDTFETIEWIFQKIAKLRIFTDEEGKMNNSIEDVQGEFLIIPQFTLYASVKKGTRPSFIKAAETVLAENLYNYFIEYACKQTTLNVETGSFGADMKVELTNDGPVTILVEKK